MRKQRWLLAIVATLALSALALVACGDDDDDDGGGNGGDAVTLGDLEITEARARFTTSENGAVYFTVTSGGAGDELVSASSGIARMVELHEIVTEGATGTMQRVDGIVVPAGDHVHLEPGGYHVMLMGVDEIPEPGATIELELEFARAGTITLEVPVEAFTASDDDHEHDDGEDHDDDDHDHDDGEDHDGG